MRVAYDLAKKPWAKSSSRHSWNAEVQAENARLREASSELEQTCGQAEAQNSQLKRELAQATDNADCGENEW